MKDFFDPIGIPAVLVLLSLVSGAPADDAPGGADDSSVLPDEMRFELAYCGLSGAADDHRYNSYYGYGMPFDGQEPFIDSLGLPEGRLHPLYCPLIESSPWAAVALAEGKEPALYLDLDQDGALSSGETIAPLAGLPGDRGVFEFVTPDFRLDGEDDGELPYRLLLQVRPQEGSAPTCMWSPCCVRKGTAVVGEESFEMVLFDSGFNGRFGDIGSDDVLLRRTGTLEGKFEAYRHRQALTRLILVDGRFYKVRIEGDPSPEGNLSALLVADRTPRGGLAVDLTGGEGLTSVMRRLRVRSAREGDADLKFSRSDPELPAGAWVVASGSFEYGLAGGERWSSSFSSGPEIAVEPGGTLRVVLGRPELSARAIEESMRYNSSARPKTRFDSQSDLFITLETRGCAGEQYGSFSRLTGSAWRNVDPAMRIVDEEGVEQTGVELQYG